MVHFDEIDDLPWDFYHLGFFRNYPDAVEYGDLFFESSSAPREFGDRWLLAKDTDYSCWMYPMEYLEALDDAIVWFSNTDGPMD